MNDTEAMTNAVKIAVREANAAAHRYEAMEALDPDSAQEYFEAKAYLEGMIDLLVTLDPDDIHKVLANLGVTTIDALTMEVNV